MKVDWIICSCWGLFEVICWNILLHYVFLCCIFGLCKDGEFCARIWRIVLELLNKMLKWRKFCEFYHVHCVLQEVSATGPEVGAPCGWAGAVRDRVREPGAAPHPAGAHARGGPRRPCPAPQRHVLHHQTDPATARPVPLTAGSRRLLMVCNFVLWY